MIEYIKFWAAKSAWDMMLGLLVLFLVFCVIFVLELRIARRQSKCSHDRVWEDRQCRAICHECGKNLGFIKTWRDAQNSQSNQKEI